MKKSFLVFVFFLLTMSIFVFSASADTELSPDETYPAITETVSDVANTQVTETPSVIAQALDPQASETDYSVFFILFCISVVAGILLAQAFSFWKW